MIYIWSIRWLPSFLYFWRHQGINRNTKAPLGQLVLCSEGTYIFLHMLWRHIVGCSPLTLLGRISPWLVRSWIWGSVLLAELVLCLQVLQLLLAHRHLCVLILASSLLFL